MNLRAARIALAAAVALASLIALLMPPVRVAAEHLPPPSEIVLRAGELPPGFAPADEPAARPTLPDGLARQATVSFRRDPALAGEPGFDAVKQMVVTFDERDAMEYLARFRDLMVRHQGYTLVSGGKDRFHLVRTRGDDTSVVMGITQSEVMIVTTISGPAGAVSAEQASHLTNLAVARVPVVERAAAAVSTGEHGGVALGNASPGGSYFNFPSIEEKGRWPSPQVNLPPPPAVDVVAQRSDLPVGDPALNEMIAVHPNRARPADLDTNLTLYIAWVSPLIDEFWARFMGQTGHVYQKPRVTIVAEGVLALSGCSLPGRPAPVLSIFYCRLDETVYIYEPFMKDSLVAGEDWQNRDFVVATVMAHEWAHHIQHLHGYSLAAAVEMHNNPELAPMITRGTELQADCFSGMFTRYARDAGWITISDLEEAQEAMLRAGDHHTDSAGHHGVPEQRKEWFMRGYVHYSLRACDAW